MNIPLIRIDKSFPIPEYKTAGAVGFDLMSRKNITIPVRGIVYAPLNVIIAIPEGYMIMLAPRSSLHKQGLMLANSVGIVDQDFCGPEDEINAALYNFSDREVVVRAGDRIVQGVIIPIVKANFEEKVATEAETRGGFGSTGK